MTDRLQLLCEKGYFLKELPPAFNSLDFGKNIRAIIQDWADNGIIPGDYRSRKKWKAERVVKGTEPETFSLPKGKHDRRILHITHPLPQALLSYVISKNWSTISAWLNRAKYSFDKTVVVSTATRSVPEPEFHKHQVHKEQIESYATWIVKSDIARFYPSIYTHSIPWAAYGKEKVKKNLRDYDDSLGDQLDVLVRKCNRNQTVGIPTGPDTSRIIADIISGYVDCEVEKKSSIDPERADRLQDDWLVGCDTLEEAESHLSKVRLTYQTLGLDINASKTSITHLSEQRHPSWTGILRPYLSNKQLKGPVLQDLCRTALSLQAEYPEEKVLNYMMASLFNKEIPRNDIPIIEAFILKAVIVNPGVIDKACELLLNYIYEKKPIDTSRVSKRFIPLVEDALENGRDFEACWGLYLLRGLKIKLDLKGIIKMSKLYEGATIPLILLDMHSRKLIAKPPVAYWEKIIQQSDLNDWKWLLAYEGVRHGWLKDATGKIASHPLLKPLYDRSVAFYNEDKNVATRKTINERRRKIQLRRQKSLAAFLAGY